MDVCPLALAKQGSVVGQSLGEEEVGGFGEDCCSAFEVIGVDKRRPLGMKEWSRQALRKEMWQEKVAMRSRRSVRYEVFFAKAGIVGPKREERVELKER